MFVHQEKVKNKITNYWLRAITFGLSNKKQNVNSREKMLCELPLLRGAAFPGRRRGRGWESDARGRRRRRPPGDGELCGEAGLSTSGSWRQVPGTCGVSSPSAAAPALAGSPNSEVPFLRATPGWLRITSGDGAQALLWPKCLL